MGFEEVGDSVELEDLELLWVLGLEDLLCFPLFFLFLIHFTSFINYSLNAFLCILPFCGCNN